jgi:hypothetical protein
MEFKLIEIKGTSAPKLSEDGLELSVFANAVIGVVGMPDEDKYKDFQKIITLSYSWDITLASDVALAGLQTFGEQYVIDNYPTI